MGGIGRPQYCLFVCACVSVCVCDCVCVCACVCVCMCLKANQMNHLVSEVLSPNFTEKLTSLTVSLNLKGEWVDN